MLASIIVNNYNYDRFLGEAIDSALNQSYANSEVIVVDDGSTDNSKEIIADYGNQIKAVFKGNGGQSSAFNAGYLASSGNILVFLDADDVLLPTALERIAGFFEEPEVAKAHWPLFVIDGQGCKTGDLIPRQTLPEGNLRAMIVSGGPSSCVSPPTTGNAWARWFLDRVFPIPEDSHYYRLGGDEYLFNLAPAFGLIRRIREPLGCYRIHGRNNYTSKSFEEKLQFELDGYEQQSLVMSRYFRDLGINVDPEIWRQNSWFHRLHQAVQEIAATIPPHATLILVDDDTWGTNTVAGRRCIPFMELDNQYWGPPSDDNTAIEALERLRRSGFHFIVFAWTAFWWLTYYTEFHYHLESQYHCIFKSELLVMFDLRK